jgi:hypothetical protein
MQIELGIEILKDQVLDLEREACCCNKLGKNSSQKGGNKTTSIHSRKWRDCYTVKPSRDNINHPPLEL